MPRAIADSQETVAVAAHGALFCCFRPTLSLAAMALLLIIITAIQLTVLHSHVTIHRSKRLPSGGDLYCGWVLMKMVRDSSHE